MSEYIRVKGNIIEKTGGTSRVYAKGGIEHNSNGFIDYFAENHTYGEPEKYVPKQPENSVNVFVGMFFDGTGNNRFNSEKTYYSKINSSESFYNAEDIPECFEFVKDLAGKGEVKVQVSDRDSYWNPYSNIVKLHDLYKEKKDLKKDESSENGGHPEYGEYLILKQYIEGIGTEKDGKDDALGSMTGRSSSGIIARVEQGIEKLVNGQFKNIPANKKINKIVFDVFGFSRGAAAARHFCNEVKKTAEYKNEMIHDRWDPKYPIPSGKVVISKHAGGLLGKKLSKAGYKPVKQTYDIEIRFLGLFDTVVGDLIVKENLGYKLLPIPYIGPIAAAIQEALQNIKTNVKDLGIKKVFHITAQSEWRGNFALTPTDTDYTLSMLGAHSDIGGGYANLNQYTSVVDFFDVPVKNPSILNEKQKVKDFYVHHHFSKDETEINMVNTYDHYLETTSEPIVGKYISWLENKDVERDPNYQPPKERLYDPTKKHTIAEKKISDHYMITDKRTIHNSYSLVAMYVMLQKALDNGVPFYDDYNKAPDVTKKFEYELPNDSMLKNYLIRMLEVSKNEGNGTYNMSSEMYSHICNKYVHLSANYGGLNFIGVKTGDHTLLGDYGFVNHPVDYIVDDNGNISYKRGIYEAR
jgi:hypothetical protein